MSQEVWRIELLGGVAAESGGVRVGRFPTKPTAGLLALLAMGMPNQQPRDELTRMLWGTGDRQMLRNRLNQAISSIRKLVPAGPDAYTSSHFALGLSPSAFVVDVREFEAAVECVGAAADDEARLAAAERAVALYGGDFAYGLEFDWAQIERFRLRALYLHALDVACELAAARGDLRRASDIAAERVRLEPRDPAYHTELARLLVASGRPHQALAQISALEARLRLAGMELDPPLEELRSQALAMPVHPSADGAPEQRVAPLTGDSEWPAKYLASLFGREDELDGLARMLADPFVRLVTVTGLGGVGKTHLAVAAIRQLQRRGLPAVFLPPDSVHAAGSLLESLASRVSTERDTPPERQVDAVRAVGPMYVLVDRVEALNQDARNELATMARTLPNITVLATGLRPLGVEHEARIALDPLPLKAGADASAAAQLFCRASSRLAAGQPPSPDGDVERLVRLLDGHPLAIEFAAGWSRLLSPAEILERLESRSLPAGMDGADESPAGSLESVIGSSIALAGHKAEPAIECVAAFLSPPTPEAVASIAGDDVLAGLRDLEELGLARTIVGRDGASRLAMLSVVRDFVLARLSDERRTELADAHAYAMLARARSHAGTTASRKEVRLDRLGAEQDDHRAAVRRHLATGRAAEAVEHVLALSRLAESGTGIAETRAMLQEALSHPGLEDAVLRRAYVRVARLSWLAGDFAAAKAEAGRQVGLAESAGDHASLGDALAVLHAEAHRVGDYETAAGLLETALEVSTGIGDEAGRARTLVGMGNLAMERSEWEDAEARYMEALDAARHARDPYWETAALVNLGYLAEATDRHETAIGFCERAGAVASDSTTFARLRGAMHALAALAHARLGNVREAEEALAAACEPWPESSNGALEVASSAAAVLAARGMETEAAALLGHIEAGTRAGGHARGLEDRQRNETRRQIEARIGEAAFERAYSLGKTMTPDEARAVATMGAAAAAEML